LNILANISIAHAHDGTFAKLLFDLCECGGQRFAFIVIHDVLPLFLGT
jgi:hypothetical protein